MSGRLLMSLLLGFAAVFGVALYYFQTYAFYERRSDIVSLEVGGEPVPVRDYVGIDSPTSPLKLRACFAADPRAFSAADPAPDAVRLTPPSWFTCFDARALTESLASGAASAYRLTSDDPRGFDVMVAIYPDGRGFLWRQLGPEFAE